MANDIASSSTSEKSSSIDNINDGGTLGQYLLGDRNGALLLGIGLFLLVCNTALFFLFDTKVNAWLCYLDMRYWSVYLSIALWVAAIWIASESIEFAENYRSYIRAFAAAVILLVTVFGLRNFFTASNIDPEAHPHWISITIAITVLCGVRSLFLFYDYRHAEEKSIDLEESQWFWGLSGFLFAGWIIFWLMNVISVKIPVHEGMDSFVRQTLFQSCSQGFRNLIQSGNGSLGLRAFGFLLIIISFAFIYVAGKWTLTFLLKMRARWE